jgi:ABC-type lipoprotein export system ATPase subunit/ABC-type antimicrobial peptide transport system permease subunit
MNLIEGAPAHPGHTYVNAKRPLLMLRGLRKVYDTPDGQVVVLKGLDLDIWPGSFNVIRGESGSGKTSLLRIIGMLDSSYEGSYYFADENLKSHPAWQIDEMRSENIGFILQDGRLFNYMNVENNVGLPIKLLGDREQRANVTESIKELAPDFFSSHEIDSNILGNYPTRVSGGQKQRAAIMRAFINRPALILADEPTASLDEDRKKEVLNLLVRLCQEGHTVVVVSHDKVFYDTGRQLELSKGELRELPEGVMPQSTAVKTRSVEVHRPKEDAGIANGWKPRAPLGILLSQASLEVTGRWLFTLLVLISIIVGVAQVSVFSSVIVGAQQYLKDAMTKGSRLTRLEFKPMSADLGETNRFPAESEMRSWGNVRAIIPRRTTTANVMNYKAGRTTLYDVKMLQDDDPEYALLDFVAGGPFTKGVSELEVIIPVTIANDILRDADALAKGEKTYNDLIGQTVTILQRKYAPTGQTVSWTPINMKVSGIVLYAEGGGPVMYMPKNTILALDRFVIDKKGEIKLPLGGTGLTEEQRTALVAALPAPRAGSTQAPVLEGGDAWTDREALAKIVDFPWEDKLQVYSTEIREIIPVFRQLSKLGYKPQSDIFDKNMKWVLDVQDIASKIFTPLLILIILSVGGTIASNIYTSAKLRESELALWRILGMRRGDLMATQIMSTMFVVLLGTAIGLVGGSILVNESRDLLVDANPKASLEAILAPVTDFIWPIVAGTVVVGLIAAIPTALQTARTDPAKVLQSG